MAEPAISFRGVTRRYPQKRGGDVVALHDIDLDVPEGAITGIIGPSGAGKTTLIERMMGLRPASPGEILHDEADAAALGATGVPFFVFDGKYAVSGAQPPETFTQALTTAWNDRPAPQLIADGDTCGPDGCAVPTESAAAD